MKLKERINEFLKTQGIKEETIKDLDSSSVHIAEQIAFYAHRNQTRINGSHYFSHPIKVLNLYRKFTGIVDGDYFCLNLDLLLECGIPYNGVQEVCLLHDVLEDTSITLNEIKEVYEDLELGHYFETYIKPPLILITHDKSEDYSTYIKKLLINPVASIVKFMDLADNMSPLTLNEFSNFELDRINRYAHYSKEINDKWHFLENIITYRQLKNRK